MKHKLLLTLSFLIACSPLALGQEPAKVGPTIYRQKFANERARVFEITFKPGQSIGMHAHPDHVVYILSGGALSITEQGKKPVTINGKAGDTFFIPAQKHSAKNVGKTTVRALVTELR